MAGNGIPVYDIDYTLVKTLVAATDLSIDPGNDTMVSSATHTFTTADIGSAVIVMRGDDWSSGGYKIMDVNDKGSAVLNGSPTTAANPNTPGTI